MNTVKTQNKRNTKGLRAISENYAKLPTITKVTFEDSLIHFHLSDKRILSIPILWIKKLAEATDAQRLNYIVRGHFVFWDEIDEIIGVKNLFNGSVIPGY